MRVRDVPTVSVLFEELEALFMQALEKHATRECRGTESPPNGLGALKIEKSRFETNWLIDVSSVQGWVCYALK